MPRELQVIIALALTGAASGLIGAGCDDEAKAPITASPTATATATATATDSEPPRPGPDSDFIRIRSLLRNDPQSALRAHNLYPLVKSVCEGPQRRQRLVADATLMIEGARDDDERARQRRSAIDLLEHIVTTCWRSTPTVAFSLLDAGSAVISHPKRFAVINARLRAAGGELAKALVAADEAIEAGSIHAIALKANIQAQQARGAQIGYRQGMLDAAIATVSVEPDNNWPLIDLTAVLSTRAQLYTEQATWESGPDVRATLAKARAAYLRLAQGPFIAQTRQHAADYLCFDSVEIGDDAPEGCMTAADKFGILGAAMLTNKDVTKAPFDQARWRALVKVRTLLDELPKGAAVVLVVRGDESELVAWGRPAAQVLTFIASKSPRLIVLDKTDSPRAQALLRRILQLARVKPVEHIVAGREVFAMPCLSAVLAGRQTPTACPFEPALVKRLRAVKPFGLAVLLGRDLDGEVDDARLYELPAVLMSFRQPVEDIPMAAHLKSVSDAWVLSSNAADLVQRINDRAAGAAQPTLPEATDR